MATRSVLVCDVCKQDVTEVTHRLRLSLRDGTDPTNVRELGDAVEPCKACVQDVYRTLVVRALARADDVGPGVVSTFLVAIDVIPLRPGP